MGKKFDIATPKIQIAAGIFYEAIHLILGEKVRELSSIEINNKIESGEKLANNLSISESQKEFKNSTQKLS